MGYLRAIQLGAEEIYETDDDNEIVSGQLPNLARGYYVYDGTNRTVVNPYAYFGYPSIWPRGYPLDQIRPEMDAEAFSRVGAKPHILQGLADKDPDVDAIFRQACMHHLLDPTHGLSSCSGFFPARSLQLEYAGSQKVYLEGCSCMQPLRASVNLRGCRRLTQPMGINFDKLSPAVVLPEGLMCPFNSQNTLFSRDALWAMLIPVTTSFRVCDIWRGYWAQVSMQSCILPPVDMLSGSHASCCTSW